MLRVCLGVLHVLLHFISFISKINMKPKDNTNKKITNGLPGHLQALIVSVSPPQKKYTLKVKTVQHTHIQYI